MCCVCCAVAPGPDDALQAPAAPQHELMVQEDRRDWAEEQIARLDPELEIVREMRAYLERSRERFPKLRERERRLYEEFVETFGDGRVH